MLQAVANAFKLPDLRKKLLFTLKKTKKRKN